MVKHISIVVVLCATVAFATKPYITTQNSGENQHQTYHGTQSTQNTEKWQNHGFSHPQFQHNSGNWQYHGYNNFPLPPNSGKWSSHMPHSSHNFGKWPSHPSFHQESKWPSHGFYGQQLQHNPIKWPTHTAMYNQGPSSNYNQHNSGKWPSSSFSSPKSSQISKESEHHGYYKPQSYNVDYWNTFPHSSSGLEYQKKPQPNPSYSVPEWNNYPNGENLNSPPPMFGNNWEHKANLNWVNPHFQTHGISEHMLRRRPLFYPIYPYYLYPHHHNVYPSNNDEEFETIEARSSIVPESDENFGENWDQQKSGHFHNLGPHNLHRPENSDSEMPFSHDHFFNFNPFHKNPEENKDENTSGEASHAHAVYPLSDDKFLFFYIPNKEMFEKWQLWLHEHVKPHHPHNKPHEESTENSKEDVEGSGEEDIIPLSTGFGIPEDPEVISMGDEQIF